MYDLGWYDPHLPSTGGIRRRDLATFWPQYYARTLSVWDPALGLMSGIIAGRLLNGWRHGVGAYRPYHSAAVRVRVPASSLAADRRSVDCWQWVRGLALFACWWNDRRGSTFWYFWTSAWRYFMDIRARIWVQISLRLRVLYFMDLTFCDAIWIYAVCLKCYVSSSKLTSKSLQN